MKIIRYLIPGMLALLVVVLVSSCEAPQDVSWADDNYTNADLVDGGLLYDKWWAVNGGTEPATDFGLYPATSAKSGSTTWRCKECHGWDYVGKDGRYSSGSHFTGIDGLMAAASKDVQVVFDAIKDEGGAHDLSAVLSDEDVLALTKFVREGFVDMSLYITDGVATGDATAGATLYNDNCATCHGDDGDTHDFDSGTDGSQGVGWLSNDNPQETLHKIRWGHPGTVMPSAVVDGGLTDDQTGDILAYAQTLPDVVHYATLNWTSADLVSGGLLYDKWWAVNGVTEPATDFSLYPGTSAKSGSTTWRCKECHGWDYVGKDGRYSSGSHYTGFDGLMAATAYTKVAIFDAIKDGGGTHDFSTVLADADVLDLTIFVLDGMVDMSLYITDGVATGDAVAGATLYNDNCASCHGADGKTHDFDSGTDGSQGVGWLSNDNPQETLHKIRWGHPGTVMPSAVVDGGLTDDQTGDILAYAQSLPFAVASIDRGGQLYDKWWAVNGVTEPTTDFSLYPGTSAKTGSTTWRCKECHGWDYIGKDGRYSSGSHYTGFDGLMAATAYTNAVIFAAIKDAGGTHDFSAVLADADVIDLTKFVAEGMVDMSLYIDATGSATGDATAGATLYAANCASCHGADGNTLDFNSTTTGVQGVGWLSNDNPQETLHKIRWGHPGSAMPSAVADGGLTDDQTGDILAHAQTL